MRYNDHQTAIEELNENERLYSAIGRFITEFSKLEFKLPIAEVIDLHDEYQDQILSHHFRLLCTIAESILFRVRDEDHGWWFSRHEGLCRVGQKVKHVGMRV